MKNNISNFKTYINENKKKDELEKEFISHFENNTKIRKELVLHLLNILPSYATDIEAMYRGVPIGNTRINNITSWTTDAETASAFADVDGEVIEIGIEEFKKKYDFVSMDVIDEYLGCTYEGYVSESEILSYAKNEISIDKISEGIVIENPFIDGYNEIMVDGEKVGYIILAPARKEYYWVDVNLSAPLAIVDIKIYPQFRGSKYMTEVMNWVYNFAKENSYKSLFLRVDDDSEISQDILLQIYQKFGFSIYRTTDGEDDIYMYKLIN